MRTPKRLGRLRALGALGALAVALAACIDTSSGYADVYISAVTAKIVDAGGPVLDVTADAYFGVYGGVEYHLDGASMTVRSNGSSTLIPNPSVDLSLFPVTTEGELPIHLTAPSPIEPPNALPEFCAATVPTVDVALRFYVPQLDRDLSRAPAVYEFTGTGTLLTSATPPPSGVFETSSVEQLPSGVLSEEVLGATSRGETTFFAVGEPDSTQARLYVVDGGGARELGVADLTSQSPVLSTTANGRLVVATGQRTPESGQDRVDVAVWSSTAIEAQLSFQSSSGPGDGVFRVSAVLATEGPDPMTPTPTLEVALESSEPLDLGLGTVLMPPDGKYFGAYLVTVDRTTGVVLDAKVAPGDVLGRVDLGGGETLIAWGDLPPADPPRLLHVERLDAAGTPVWSATYPMLTYAVDLNATPEGGALVIAVDETALDEHVVALRLDDQGQLVFARTFAGTSGSGAALADGSTLVAFTGASDLGAPEAVVSAAAAPTLVELDAEGAPTRSLATACGGTVRVSASDGGGATVALSFSELASIGDAVLNAVAGTLVVARLPGTP